MKRFIFIFLLFYFPLFTESILEKKELLKNQSLSDEQIEYEHIHQEMTSLRYELKNIYAQSANYLDKNSLPAKELEELLKKSKQIKSKLMEKERLFKKMSAQNNDDEYFSLMHEKEITLEQLILDYASSNFLYVIPSEMAKLQLNLSSSIPIPKAAWEEIVELICAQNGIGIKPLNSFVKTLYWIIANDTSSLKHLAYTSEQLEVIDPNQRVCFFLPLEGSEFQKVSQFLQKFINNHSTSQHLIGNNIVLIGQASEIKEINKLISFVRQHQNEKSYKLLSIDKMPSEDWQNILKACFSDTSQESGKVSESSILIYPMQKYLLVLGSPKDLEKAERIISAIHEQVMNPKQMTLHWYTCKYSEPYELASLLPQVYQMMVHQVGDTEIENEVKNLTTNIQSVPSINRCGQIPPICDTAPKMVVNPPRASPADPQEQASREPLPNFIVDAKSGMIIMVVKQSYLPKLRELAKKLDIVKKMVQIEVLLFEKKIKDQTQFGLNLSNLGEKTETADAGARQHNRSIKRSMSR